MNTNQARIEKIKTILTLEFAPSTLQIDDQSHLHIGHAGAKSGKGHFQVVIKSSKFAGVALIDRHKMVYAALGDLMQTDIHALKLQTLA